MCVFAVQDVRGNGNLFGLAHVGGGGGGGGSTIKFAGLDSESEF